MPRLSRSTAIQRRVARVRAKLSGTPERPRLAVSRSLRHISAQLVDDTRGRTLAAARDFDLEVKARTGKNKTDIAKSVGQLLAERAKAAGIEQAVFDRRDKRYHGRVRALAEGAREGGLLF